MQHDIIDAIEAYSNVLLEKNEKLNILAVEDDPVAMVLLEEHISQIGHNVYKAANGQEALNILKQHAGNIDIVVMDKQMPVMDGLTVVKHMKNDKSMRKVPIIMVTGSSKNQDMKEGLDAGVFYYLTKPVEGDILKSVLAAAVKEATQSKNLDKEIQKHKTSFHLIQNSKFRFQTIQEAECLAAFMSLCFPDPERTLPGLAELLINAVEHGNLQIGYDRKTELIDQGIWRAEIERLQEEEEHKGKFVEVSFAKKEEGVYATIKDEGSGFAWQNYIKIDPARADHNHGRGIAQAATISFDKLTYNEIGNQVAVYSSFSSKEFEW